MGKADKSPEKQYSFQKPIFLDTGCDRYVVDIQRQESKEGEYTFIRIYKACAADRHVMEKWLDKGEVETFEQFGHLDLNLGNWKHASIAGIIRRFREEYIPHKNDGLYTPTKLEYIAHYCNIQFFLEYWKEPGDPDVMFNFDIYTK